jgi:hypothetical protein
VPAWAFNGASELGGLCGERLDARVETSLVTAGGVLVEDALLHTLIEHGDRGAVLHGGCLGVASGEGLTHRTEGAAELGLVGAIDGRAGDGLAGALEGRNVICHQKLSCNPDVAGNGCRPEGWNGHNPATSSATPKFSVEWKGRSMFLGPGGFR